jgi:Ni,Fe-hydrogenase III component G
MDTATALHKAEEILKPLSGAMTHPEVERVDILLTAAQLLPAVRALLDAKCFDEAKQWQRMSEDGENVPGSHATLEGGVEILYHFCEGAAIATLRIVLPYSRANIASVCDLIPSATLYERELMEMFGVNVVGTPNPDKLLLPDDWPDGTYPMRKSYIVEIPGK